MPALGRLPFRPDGRDWPLPRLRALVESGAAVPLDWSVTRILNQGDNGTCVAAGILGACDCDDANHVISQFSNADIVPFFRMIAGHGALPEGGAEVREGLKAAKAAGYISAYSLLGSEAEILEWWEHYGPCVFGVDWWSEMEHPDNTGRVSVGGRIEGGHCVYGNGDLSGFDFVNSWGSGWGAGGHFHMSREAFEKLARGDFEAWAVVQAAAPQLAPDEHEPLLRSLLAELCKILRRLTRRCS
jgi:hypothetical protein